MSALTPVTTTMSPVVSQLRLRLLDDTVDILARLDTHGIEVREERHYFTLGWLSADIPARAMLLNVQGVHFIQACLGCTSLLLGDFSNRCSLPPTKAAPFASIWLWALKTHGGFFQWSQPHPRGS